MIGGGGPKAIPRTKRLSPSRARSLAAIVSGLGTAPVCLAKTLGAPGLGPVCAGSGRAQHECGNVSATDAGACELASNARTEPATSTPLTLAAYDTSDVAPRFPALFAAADFATASAFVCADAVSVET